MNLKIVVFFSILSFSQAHIPSLAAVMGFNRFEHLFVVFGGGTIINEYWILANAETIKKIDVLYLKDDVKVVVGNWNIENFGESGSSYDLADFIPHENADFTRGVSQFNIGLIRVRNPIRFNEWVKASLLPSNLSHRYHGNAVAAGWLFLRSTLIPESYNDPLHSANVNILARETCINILEEILMKRTRTNTLRNYILGSHICTSALVSDNVECDGYSGGPLLQKNASGEDEVIALTTNFTTPSESIILHTMVAPHLIWIHTNMRNNPSWS